MAHSQADREIGVPGGVHHRRYRAVAPDDKDRRPIPELDLEIGLLDGWARYWFRGELLPLPAEMANRLEVVTRERDTVTRERDAAVLRSEELGWELARLGSQLGLTPP